MTINLEIKNYPINSLIFSEYNPRQLMKDQYKHLRDSLERFGFVDPCIINKHPDRENIVIGGHQRIRIAQDLGIKEIPCVEVELDADRERELNIRLNKNVGEWDWDALANYFDVGELTEWGFTDDELQFYEDEPTDGLIDDDEIPEVEEAITKTGDLWILGEHRLLCGDATKKEEVERLMDGKKADMVFTDPPYGMFLNVEVWNTPQKKGQWVSNKKDYGAVRGDNEDFTPELINTVFNNFGYCKEIFLWGADYYAELIPEKNKGSWVSWDKRAGGLEDVQWSTSEFELCWSKQRHQRKIARIRWMGVHGMEKQDTAKRVHPTQKPNELVEWFFGKWGDGLSNVIDLFLGSGSTLIACEKTNRKCYGMEIDPHYCDVIVKRWEEFTGNKAERVERAES